MITLEVRIPFRCVFAVLSYAITIPTIAFAILIAKNGPLHYSVALYILAGALLLECVAKLGWGFWPYNIWACALNGLLLIVQFVTGAYWLSQRLEIGTATRYEVPLAILWALNLLVSTNIHSVLAVNSFKGGVSLASNAPSSPVNTLEGSEFELHEKKAPRAHKSTGSLVSFKRKHRTQSAPNNAPAPLAGLDAVPEGFLDLSWDVNSNVQYMIQNAQQRNFSGSTQQSNFAATEYNKRISSAGFLKDEPTVLKKPKKSKTFSHYDLEQNRLQEIV